VKPPNALDDIDSRIIRLLQRHGRHSIAAVSRGCSMSETAVRKRVNRLVRDGTIKFVTVVNPPAVGYDVNIMFTVKAEAGRLEAISEQLCAKHEVVWLSYTTGPLQLMGEAIMKDQDELHEFLHHFLAGIDGVLWVETYGILKIPKFNYEWRPEED
jgi:DNA-binding Lrp family transcriptional regulator